MSVRAGCIVAMTLAVVAGQCCWAFPGVMGSGHSTSHSTTYGARRNLHQLDPERTPVAGIQSLETFDTCPSDDYMSRNFSPSGGTGNDIYNVCFSYVNATRTAGVIFKYKDSQGWAGIGLPDLGGTVVIQADSKGGASSGLYNSTGDMVTEIEGIYNLAAEVTEDKTVLRGSFDMKIPANANTTAFPINYLVGKLDANKPNIEEIKNMTQKDALKLESADPLPDAKTTVEPAPALSTTPGAAAEANVAASAAPTLAITAAPTNPALPLTGPVGAPGAVAAMAPTLAPQAEEAPQPATEMPVPDSPTIAPAADPESGGMDLPVDTSQVPTTTEAPTGGACSKMLEGGIEETFTSCATLGGGTPGGEYTFLWRLDNNILRGAIEGDVTDGSGYIGWGQGPGGRQMVPGNAIIVKTNGTDGASVDHYALNDKRTSQVITPSAWTVTDMRAARTNGRLQAVFTLMLNPTQVAAVEAFDIIHTKGSVSNGGKLRAHDPSNGNAATLNLTSGAVAETLSVGNDRRTGNLPTAHGWLAAVGLGLGLPLAAACARTLKELKPGWFHAHRAIALLAYLCGVAAIGMGLYMRPMVGAAEKAHEVMGVLALVLGFLQVTAIAARPSEDHRLRKAWAMIHQNIGRVTVVVVIINVYIGITMSDHIASDSRKNWYIVYSVFLVLIVALAVAKEVHNIVTKRPPHDKSLLPQGTTTGKGAHSDDAPTKSDSGWWDA